MGARRLLVIALAASTCSINVLAKNIQKAHLTVPAKYAKDKAAVVGIFNESYSAYKFVSNFPLMLFLMIESNI